MSCSASRPGPFRCPTLQEIMGAMLALLPRGRAWQSHEGGPAPIRDTGFGPGFHPPAFDSGEDRKPASILYRFWISVAAVFWFLNQRLCALRLEFWCATHSETHAEWMREYGLPDPCDPFPDLCVKVAAIGGQRCEYFNAIIARMGWSVTCVDWAEGCGSQTGCGRAGRATAGGGRAAKLSLLVNLNESPAYVARARTRPPLAGALRAGYAINCPEPYDLTPLRCLINRIAPAHVEIEYLAYEGI